VGGSILVNRLVSAALAAVEGSVYPRAVERANRLRVASCGF
jgi:hypothetical protein